MLDLLRGTDLARRRSPSHVEGMKPFLWLPLVGSLLAAGGCASPKALDVSAPTVEPDPPSSSVSSAPLPLGLDESAIDRTANPCDDFYRFACGSWMDKTEIPADRSSMSRGFVSIAERNELVQREILERAAAGKVPGENGKKLGHHWSTCMDEPRLESSLALLQKEAKTFAAIKDGKSLARVVGKLHVKGVNVLFDLSSMQDLKDSTVVVGGLSEAGLGLPDRDYYLVDDDKTKKVRDAYLGHVEQMLVLAGDKPEAAKRNRDLIFALEKTIATATRTKEEKRDVEKTYHRLERVGLQKSAPSFDWVGYFKVLKSEKLTNINVAHPSFIEAMEKIVKATKPEVWNAYLRWALLRANIPALPKAMQEERFRYESAALTGAKEDRPRWKKCVALADAQLGEALGQVFVDEQFGKDGKERTLAMVVAVEAAFDKNLDALSWMDEPTRTEARAKARKMTNKIGFPDVWRDYSAYTTSADSFLTNYQNGIQFMTGRDLAKIGKPVDKNEWYMSPPTVNAYNDGQMNEIVFPAGILQPPFFTKDAPDAVNFGAIGMVVGHEITHGFDDEGRKLDKDGNLRDWWTPAVSELFVAKTNCVKDQFSASIALEDIKVNGQLTLGENTADLGGLKVSMLALKEWHKAHAPAPSTYAQEQLFFLGYAQSWCSKYRPEQARLRAATDPHAPPFLRVNNPLQNLPEFAAAFHCKPTDKMVKATRCEVW